MINRHPLKTWAALVACLLTFSVNVVAQDLSLEGTPKTETAPATQALQPGLESPASTLRTFIEAMVLETPDREAAIRCMDLSEVTVEAGWPLAIKLYGAINKMELVEFADHPDVAELADDPITEYLFYPRAEQDLIKVYQNLRHAELSRLTGPSARIMLVRNEHGWQFSADTVAGIESLFDTIKDQPNAAVGMRDVSELSTAIAFERHLPEWAVERGFGLKIWQWIGLLLLIFIGVMLDFTLRFLLSSVARTAISRQGGTAQPESIKRTVRPFGAAAAGIFWLFTIELLDMPQLALGILLPAVRLFYMLALVWSSFRLTDLAGEVFTSKAERTDTKFDDLLVPLVRRAIKVFIFVFGLIYIANSFHIPIAPLLTGLGIGGAGFAFAAKDTLEHIFGSITVIADRPFQVGDWIVIGDTEGTVEEVGFRSTRVRTFYNSLVTVPNGNLVRAVVDNYGQRKYRRWTTHINITYGTSTEQVESFCEGIRELIRSHPYTRKDYYQCWLHKFGPSSLDILVYLFFECPDWSTELRERHRFMLDVMRLAHHLGIDFAFPTQTLHLHPDGESPPAPEEDAPETGTQSAAQRAGRDAVRQLTRNAAWRTRKPGAYRFNAAGTDDDDDETQIESKIGGDAG